MKISATILLKGTPRHIEAVIQALVSLDEVLIYDNGADNQTLNTCKTFSNVRIIKGEFFGFGKTHNLASNLASNDWILSIDSDEVATPELIKEIQNLSLHDKTVYSIPRRNLYRDHWVKGCGWWPDKAFRLYNKKFTQFSSAQVHESVETKNLNVTSLKSCLNHYSYDSVSDFLKKMQSYSDLFAEEWKGKKKSSPCKAALHAGFAFFKSYILKWGIRDGYSGFLISAYNGHTAFYKYMKLYEMNLSMRLCPDEKANLSRSLEDAQK